MSDLAHASPSPDDQAQCMALIHAFCSFIDHGQPQQVVDLFSEDGVFERRGVALRGRAQIAAAMAARSAQVITRHICSNIMLRAESAERITGVTYFQLFRHDRSTGTVSPAPSDLLEAIGEYQDVFERTAQGWRFAHRVAVPVFQRQS